MCSVATFLLSLCGGVGVASMMPPYLPDGRCHGLSDCTAYCWKERAKTNEADPTLYQLLIGCTMHVPDDSGHCYCRFLHKEEVDAELQKRIQECRTLLSSFHSINHVLESNNQVAIESGKRTDGTSFKNKATKSTKASSTRDSPFPEHSRKKKHLFAADVPVMTSVNSKPHIDTAMAEHVLTDQGVLHDGGTVDDGHSGSHGVWSHDAGKHDGNSRFHNDIVGPEEALGTWMDHHDFAKADSQDQTTHEESEVANKPTDSVHQGWENKNDHGHHPELTSFCVDVCSAGLEIIRRENKGFDADRFFANPGHDLIVGSNGHRCLCDPPHAPQLIRVVPEHTGAMPGPLEHQAKWTK